MKQITLSLMLILSSYTIHAMESGSDISTLTVSDSDIREVTKYNGENQTPLKLDDGCYAIEPIYHTLDEK